MDAVFEAVGDPTRRQILEPLASGEQPAGALVAALQARAPISQPAVSQHLKALREAGLVTVRVSMPPRHGSPGSPTRWRHSHSHWTLATEVARGRRARRGAQSEKQPGERRRRLA